MAQAGLFGEVLDPGAVAIHSRIDTWIASLGAALAPRDDSSDLKFACAVWHDVQRAAAVALAGILAALIVAAAEHVVRDLVTVATLAAVVLR